MPFTFLCHFFYHTGRAARITLSSWAVDRSGAPDVPSGLTNSATLLKAEKNSPTKEGLLASAFFASPGDGKGKVRFLTFLHQLGDKKAVVKWDTAVTRGMLYIQLPEDPLHECSRDSLVELLDVAEEFSSRAIVFFSKKRNDMKQLVRTFKFIGFDILPPSCDWIPTSQEFFFMSYEFG
ncbi:ornithine decarboxylase antizyme 1 [Apostichopus japonicus]|uniref:Ornithine decarboxylase antizyme n=1 Tax=Stichopus japonicus TaxID=307972 RepID=A0A2G8KY48_STIJA|nr:ornithine decarboxylase antizyme 1 [Apostichopus japonicus]